MVARDELAQLQHKCKGEGKENLYDLIGLQVGSTDHEALLTRLARKRDSWSKIASKPGRLDAVEMALRLLKTPADKDEYDRFIGSTLEPQTPPVNPQQGGDQQPPVSQPRPQQRTYPRPKPGLPSITFGRPGFFAKLAMLAVGLAMLMQLTTVLNRVIPSTTTPSRAPSESGAEAEEGGASGGASTRTERETARPSSSPGESAGSTSTERGGTTPMPEPETELVVVETAPVSGPNEAGTVPIAEPPAPAPSLTTSSASGTQPQAGTAAPPVVEPVEPARPDPPPVVEPVRAGSSQVAQPRKTWNVTPEYPRLARMRRTQGIVILEVTVDRQGAVSNVLVLRSAEGLDEAAVEAVRQWRYEPTIVNGRPVSVFFTETVRFQI